MAARERRDPRRRLGAGRLGVGAVVAAIAIGAVRSRLRRRTPEPVPEDLLALGTQVLQGERDNAERFNVRASALIGFAGVLLGLAVNVGKDTFALLAPQDPGTPALDLGTVGEPVFVVCFIGSVILLSACAVVATTAVLPTQARRFPVRSLRAFAEQRIPLPDVRARVYRVTVNALEDQRTANLVKSKRLKIAGALFVSAILLVAIDAATLALTVLEL